VKASEVFDRGETRKFTVTVKCNTYTENQWIKYRATFDGVDSGEYFVNDPPSSDDQDGYLWNTYKIVTSGDEGAPVVYITENSQVINTNTFTVHWETNALDIDHYEISVDGKTWTDTDDKFCNLNLQEGDNGFYVRGVDTSNNVGDAATITITLDTEAPNVAVLPSQCSIEKDYFFLCWSSLSNDIEHYEVCIDGSSWENVGKTTSHKFYNPPDGIHRFYVKAIDYAGNTDSDFIEIKVIKESDDKTPGFQTALIVSSFIIAMLYIVLVRGNED